jgi:hypothetical protein
MTMILTAWPQSAFETARKRSWTAVFPDVHVDIEPPLKHFLNQALQDHRLSDATRPDK